MHKTYRAIALLVMMAVAPPAAAITIVPGTYKMQWVISKEQAYEHPFPNMAPFAAKPVNAVEAEGVARSFLGKGGHVAMTRVGSEMKCKYAPSLKCHVFDMPLNVQGSPGEILHRKPGAKGGYTATFEPGRWLHAEIWVEENTGRILAYEPDVAYRYEKNRKRRRLHKSDLMAKEKAIRIAEGYMRRAGVYSSDMRLSISFLEQWYSGENYFGYDLVWSRYKFVDGVGEVEFPDHVLITVDAETGELDDLLYQQREVHADLSAPKIPKGAAIKLARARCRPDAVVSTDARLIIYVDPDPEESNDQALAWRVCFYNKKHDESNPLEAAIDAHSGKVIYYTAVPGL